MKGKSDNSPAHQTDSDFGISTTGSRAALSVCEGRGGFGPTPADPQAARPSPVDARNPRDVDELA